uniref:hypothetical protein n=1 Tax=Pedobacter schmidteae TaxID=2201271 RepID=UPI0013CEAB4D|nr:hypothetical protein [Pedobacter schmidteae]
MSLQEFTWQQFLVAAVVLSALWVLGVWLIYWRPLSRGGLSAGRGNGMHNAGDALPHSWQDEVDEFSTVDALDDGLMGKPALEHGVSVLDADEFSFVPLEELGEREEHGDQFEGKRIGVEGLLADLDDAKEEIKGICRILEKEDGNKEDFFALFEVVRLKYPKVVVPELLAELNDFIREQVPFYLSKQELDSLWL